MATKKRTTSARSKDTLHDELERVRNALLAKEELDPISAAAEAKRKADLAEQLGTVTSKAVTEKIGALSLDAQATLDALRTTLISSTQELEDLREMIAVESERLEDLYGKDVVASSIATLVEEYEQKKREFEEAAAACLGDLNQKIDDQKKAEAERLELMEKQRAKEEEEYNYQLQKRRREEEDAFQQKMLEAERASEDKARELVRGWKEREEALKEQEEEVAEMREKIAEFPTILETEKKKHADSIVRAVTSEHNHKVALLEQKAASEKALLESEKKSLQQQLNAANQTIADLGSKLAAAESRVESIARSAMERDSGKAALEASQRTIETMKDMPSGKR